MSLKEDFKKIENQINQKFYKHSTDILRVGSYSSDIYHYYNFTLRLLTTKYNGESIHIMPFSELDRETLEFLHDKLTNMGGKPPALSKIKNEEFNKPMFQRKNGGQK